MTTQEPQKGTMEEKPGFHMMALAKSECAKNAGELTVVRLGYVTQLLEEQYDTLHHQLQKARQDWLREEIVRLEKKMQYPCQHGPSESCDTDCMYQDTEEKTFIRLGHNQVLQTIIDRYSAELNQPTNNQTL